MIWTPRKSLLRTPWLWLPKPLAFAAPGGYPCCCEKPVCAEPQGGCIDNESSWRFQLDIAGIVQGTCLEQYGDCTELNGSFVLECFTCDYLGW
ncbi:MAG: hypothetical protein KAY32_18350, partial [Candidatus Eisenbacteria sp.]|nr:hypothetical protein [Candidatus Eisenbacteria bacterium]